MRDIRKISVGPDYKDAMHYIVGHEVLGGSHKIEAILLEDDGSIEIYIRNIEHNTIKMWKSFTSTVPVSIEYNINF